MTRKALDPNLASILDSIRATVGAEVPAPLREVEEEEDYEEAVEADRQQPEPDAPEDVRPAKATKVAKAGSKAAPIPAAAGRSVEDFLAELIRPQVEAWLNAHLPELVQKMAADEIARLTGKK